MTGCVTAGRIRSLLPPCREPPRGFRVTWADDAAVLRVVLAYVASGFATIRLPHSLEQRLPLDQANSPPDATVLHAETGLRGFGFDCDALQPHVDRMLHDVTRCLEMTRSGHALRSSGGSDPRTVAMTALGLQCHRSCPFALDGERCHDLQSPKAVAPQPVGLESRRTGASAPAPPVKQSNSARAHPANLSWLRSNRLHCPCKEAAAQPLVEQWFYQKRLSELTREVKHRQSDRALPRSYPQLPAEMSLAKQMSMSTAGDQDEVMRVHSAVAALSGNCCLAEWPVLTHSPLTLKRRQRIPGLRSVFP